MKKNGRIKQNFQLFNLEKSITILFIIQQPNQLYITGLKILNTVITIIDTNSMRITNKYPYRSLIQIILQILYSYFSRISYCKVINFSIKNKLYFIKYKSNVKFPN